MHQAMPASMRSAKQKSESVPGAWRGWRSGEMGTGFSRFSALFEMLENLFNDRRIFDTGNNLDGTATILTGFNVDIEYALQSLRPSHGGASL